ncbi:hypothetical protein [Desulfoscipio gibsoniae]|uniref:Uncharacterized protein n=1 Tax=Desulfoscipio gibsoniae DSM 7213 TaxID=767817 RepID=R4KG83_9FIRM|nr:hypothetical protein [Desulfoscipio gibsoniae]AGL01604.1 hypothetical protein Desgi_2173 [Desulfoscipio gibsoniae DSM 7213]
MQFKHWARKILGYNGPPDHVDFSLVETGEEQELISENNDKDNVATSKSQRHKIRKPKKTGNAGYVNDDGKAGDVAADGRIFKPNGENFVIIVLFSTPVN